LTVAVNNTLTPTTLPPGTITYKNDTSRYKMKCMSFITNKQTHAHTHRFAVTVLVRTPDEKGFLNAGYRLFLLWLRMLFLTSPPVLNHCTTTVPFT